MTSAARLGRRIRQLNRKSAPRRPDRRRLSGGRRERVRGRRSATSAVGAAAGGAAGEGRAGSRPPRSRGGPRPAADSAGVGRRRGGVSAARASTASPKSPRDEVAEGGQEPGVRHQRGDRVALEGQRRPAGGLLRARRRARRGRAISVPPGSATAGPWPRSSTRSRGGSSGARRVARRAERALGVGAGAGRAVRARSARSACGRRAPPPSRGGDQAGDLGADQRAGAASRQGARRAMSAQDRRRPASAAADGRGRSPRPRRHGGDGGDHLADRGWPGSRRRRRSSSRRWRRPCGRPAPCRRAPSGRGAAPRGRSARWWRGRRRR